MYNAKTESTIKNIKKNMLEAEIVIDNKIKLADEETVNILNNYKDHIKRNIAKLTDSIVRIAEKTDDEYTLDIELDRISSVSNELRNKIIEKVNNFNSKTEDELEIESIKNSVRDMFNSNNDNYDYIMNCVKEVGESLVSTIENRLAENEDGINTKDLVYDIAEKSLNSLREKLDNE